MHLKLNCSGSNSKNDNLNSLRLIKIAYVKTNNIEDGRSKGGKIIRQEEPNGKIMILS